LLFPAAITTGYIVTGQSAVARAHMQALFGLRMYVLAELFDCLDGCTHTLTPENSSQHAHCCWLLFRWCMAGPAASAHQSKIRLISS